MDIVRTLLAAGANIHTQNAGSENVLPKFMSDLEMLQFFLDRGVDPNHVDDDGETPLHHACWKSPSEIVTASVELLLGFGAATVETADHSGGTPVDNAMFEENLEVVKILEPLVENPLLQQRISKWWKKERTATALTRSCL
jgi:ankyrin repeat protein